MCAGDNSNQSADDSCDDDDSNSSYRRRMKNKRGIFPKSATGILKTWLFQNLAVRLYIVAMQARIQESTWGLLATGLNCKKMLILKGPQIAHSFISKSSGAHIPFPYSHTPMHQFFYCAPKGWIYLCFHVVNCGYLQGMILRTARMN